MRKTLALCWLLCIPLLIPAQQYFFREYSVREGLPRTGVYDLIQDSKGYLWVATEGGGVAVYDGYSFRNISVAQGLPSNIIRCLYEDSRGNIWMGTQGEGLIRYTSNGLRQYNTESGLPSDVIRSITEGPDGSIWAGCMKGGLARILPNGDSIQVIAKKDGLRSNNVRALMRDSRGRIIIGTDKGMFIFQDELLMPAPINDSLYDQRILCLFEDDENAIWAGTRIGAVLWKDGNTRIYTTADGLIHNRIRSICQDNNGNFWFGTLAGASMKSENTFISFNEKNGLSNQRIRKLYFDRSNNLWFGTYFGGINKISGLSFFNLTVKDGLTNNQVFSLKFDNTGKLWIGSLEGISLYDPVSGLFKELPEAFELITNDETTFTDIEHDKFGRVWFGTNQGLFIWDGENMHFYTPNDGPFPSGINCLEIIHDTILLAGNNNGLIAIPLRKESINIKGQFYDSSHGMSGNNIYCMKAAHSTCLIGFVDGNACSFDGRVFTQYDGPDNFHGITGFATMKEESVCWAGTSASGIFVKGQDSKWKAFSNIEALKSLSVFYLANEGDSVLWAGSPIGLHRFTLRKDGSCLSWKPYGVKDGFAGLEDWSNAACSGPQGNIWFGTIQGLLCHSPELFQKNKVPPLCHILSVKLSKQEVNWKNSSYCDGTYGYFNLPSNLVLPYNKNNISFDFVGINLRMPDHVGYRIKLENFDNDWNEIYGQRSISYTNLPPGSYTFLVQAANEDGILNAEPLAFSFVIKPPFWKTSGFIIASILLGILAFYAFTRLRERKLRRDKKRLEEEIRKATAVIQQEKAKSEELLLNILPAKVAFDLIENGKTKPQNFPEVSVFFSDLVGFTSISSQLEPQYLIDELNDIFTAFDDIIAQNHCERIKTIGDAYLAVCGMPEPNPDHAKLLVKSAIQIRNYIEERSRNSKIKWKIRIGIHSGPVVGGVVGVRKYIFDVFGDSINTASRMESSSEPMKINISEHTWKKVKDDFTFEERGMIDVKGKGPMNMFFVENLK